MGDGANIEQAGALYRLRDSLASFQDNGQSIVDQSLTGLQREESWIAERVRYWTAEVATRRAALALCQAFVSEDGGVPDCSGPAALLQESIQALAKAKQWQERIQSAGESFRQDASSFATTLAKCSGARAFLDRKGQRVDAYSQGSFERSGHGPKPPTPANIGTGSSIPQLHLGRTSHTIRTSPGHGGPSRGASPASGGSSSGGLLPAGLPPMGLPAESPPVASPSGLPPSTGSSGALQVGSTPRPPTPKLSRSRAAQLLGDLNKSLEDKEK
jgi:hypothetical protein